MRRTTSRSVCALLLLLLACGPSGGSAPPAVPAKPAGQTAAGQGQPAAAPRAGQSAATGQTASWEELGRAAAPEGRVVVATGAAVDPSWRTLVNDTFGKRFGLQVEVLPLGSGELIARAKREAQAGQQSIDVYVGGAPSGWTIAQDGLLEPIRPWLVMPEVTSPEHWRGGRLKLLDPDPNYHLQTSEWVMTDLTVNRDLIGPTQVTTWQDLLRPEYKGKIAGFDPRAPGAGQSTATHLFERFGKDYLQKLYVEQEMQLTRDNRQLAEWLARGAYPIGLSLLPATIEQMTQEGFKLERVFPTDGPGALTGGSGVITVFKGARHPNAARLFVNWFASREGQDVWARTVREPPLRVDVDLSPVPPYIVPREGVDYGIDHYDYDFFRHRQVETNGIILSLLGR
jgi:ABC-type Fe3+ transport system substrate-binding protein